MLKLNLKIEDRFCIYDNIRDRFYMSGDEGGKDVLSCASIAAVVDPTDRASARLVYWLNAVSAILQEFDLGTVLVMSDSINAFVDKVLKFKKYDLTACTGLPEVDYNNWHTVQKPFTAPERSIQLCTDGESALVEIVQAGRFTFVTAMIGTYDVVSMMLPVLSVAANRRFVMAAVEACLSALDVDITYDGIEIPKRLNVETNWNAKEKVSTLKQLQSAIWDLT